jgi:Flp pilus assembly protein TadG
MLLKLLRLFRKNEDGNASVEFVIWLPIIMGVVVGTFDLNMVLLTQSQMWDVARDVARQVSIGTLDTSTGATYALTQLNSDSNTYTVTITSSTDVVVSISRLMEDIAVIGSLTEFNSYQVNASVTMRSEL